jgi:hypothetical protein
MDEARAELSKMFWKHAGPIWEKAGVVARTVGGGAASIEANHATAVALPIGESAHLVQFSTQCNAEEVTADLPFMSLGSGQTLADPFLAFLRRVFWPTDLPSLLDGQLAAVWTLDHVIRVNAGGVAGNIQLVVLTKDASGRNWRCDAVSQEDVDELPRGVAKVERKMASLPALTSSEPVSSPPTSDVEPAIEEIPDGQIVCLLTPLVGLW